MNDIKDEDRIIMELGQAEAARREYAVPIRIERIERMLIAICESLTSHTALVVR